LRVGSHEVRVQFAFGHTLEMRVETQHESLGERALVAQRLVAQESGGSHFPQTQRPQQVLRHWVEAILSVDLQVCCIRPSVRVGRAAKPETVKLLPTTASA